MRKNKPKSISEAKPYSGEYSGLQEKIVNRLILLFKKPETSLHEKLNSEQTEIIKFPFVQREIHRQKILLLSELLTANQ